MPNGIRHILSICLSIDIIIYINALHYKFKKVMSCSSFDELASFSDKKVRMRECLQVSFCGRTRVWCLEVSVRGSAGPLTSSSYTKSGFLYNM